MSMHKTPKRRLSFNASGSGPSQQSRPTKRSRLSATAENSPGTLGFGCCDPHTSTAWPAPQLKMDDARTFIRECADGNHLTLIVPDKDADGLSSGKIMHHTLVSIGLPADKIKVHMLGKSASVFQEDERAKMEAFDATRIIVLDQGSRGGPSLVDTQGGRIRTLILDHHESDEFPEETLVVSACRSPPVATSSLLTYLVCEPLHSGTCHNDLCSTFSLLGVFGDLGPTHVKNWDDNPWPSRLGAVMKRVTKKALSDAVSMMNAPRRMPEYAVQDTWDAIVASKTLKEISTNPVFVEARSRVNAEVERCSHTAPKFTKDGKVAVFRICSGFQVHPVIATRWAGHLKAKNLQFVMVANSGYHPSKQHTNFSCRIIGTMRRLPEPEQPNIINLLKGYGRKVKDSDSFFERVGGDFAKGHKEASGGIILNSDFDLLMDAMEVGVKSEPLGLDLAKGKSSKTKPIDPSQKTKLTAYFSSRKA